MTKEITMRPGGRGGRAVGGRGATQSEREALGYETKPRSHTRRDRMGMSDTPGSVAMRDHSFGARSSRVLDQTPVPHEEGPSGHE